MTFQKLMNTDFLRRDTPKVDRILTPFVSTSAATLLVAACWVSAAQWAGAQEESAKVLSNSSGEPSLLAALESEVVNVIARAEPAVVSIVRGRFEQPLGGLENPMAPGGGLNVPWNRSILPDDPGFVPDQFGAGVIVSTKSGERVILTNQHVVRGAPMAGSPESERSANSPRVYVRLHDGQGFYGDLRSADPRSDLAVVVPDESQGSVSLPEGLPISEAKEHHKGEIVFVLGNPYAVARDGSISAGWGIIGNILRRPAPFEFPMSAESRHDETVHHHGTLLQLDCRADLGFSGGATINRKGELIGLTTSVAALEGYESTTGFAIPLDSGMDRILQSLLEGHEPEYGFLGVGPADASERDMRVMMPGWELNRGAVRIDFAKPGSAGARAGLQAGDAVISIDGKPLRSSNDLFREIGLAGPGNQVNLAVIRQAAGGQKPRHLSVSVRLDKWPVVNDQDLVATVPRREPWRGLLVDYATARARYLTAQLNPYPQGVVVLSAEEPLGGEKKLEAGDFIVAVNEQEVMDPDEFYALVRDAEAVNLRLSDGREITVR